MAGMQRRERFIALAVALAVQVISIGALSRVPGMPTSRHPVVDEALQVVFLRRPSVPATASREPASSPRVVPRARSGGPASDRLQRPDDSADIAPDTVPATTGARAVVAGMAPLDLRVPEVAPPPFAESRRDAFGRPRMDARTTRFARDWRDGGTVLDAAKRRSPVAAFALSLFGGPPRHCDEVERRLRKPYCLPEDDEAVEP